MQSYPSIPAFNDRYHSYLFGQPCYVFRKYDGSNLRFEVDQRGRLVKVGTRTRLMDRNDPVFGPAIPYFERHLLPELVDRVSAQLSEHIARTVKRWVFFGEWFGANSFAGSHDSSDEMQLKLFDVHVGNHGFIDSNVFYTAFCGDSRTAELLYTGFFLPEHVTEVRQNFGTFEAPLEEGVVAHVKTSRGWEKVKVKTQRWLERVKAKYDDDWERYA